MTWVFEVRRAAKLIAITVALVSTPAFAEPTAAQKETARSLVESGRGKRKSGNVKAALADFEAAHAIMQVPTTGLEVGKTQMELSLLVEARQTFFNIGRLPEEPNEPRPFKKARAEAKELAGQLADRIPAVRIVVTGLPSNRQAEVAVDDTVVAKEVLGAPIKLNPGKHSISAKIDGKERNSVVELEEGQTRDVTLELASLVESSSPRDQRTNPLVVVGFGAAGVFGIAGAITGGLAMRDYATATAGCDRGRCPPETHPAIDRGTTLGIVSTIGFAVAGAGLAVGVVGLFMPRRPPEKKEARASSVFITVSPSGLGFTGSF